MRGRITAIRHLRVPEESAAMATFEEIPANPTDLQNLPAKGNWVTACGAQYSVTSLRQPIPTG
jgi:hypothetical protein